MFTLKRPFDVNHSSHVVHSWFKMQPLRFVLLALCLGGLFATDTSTQTRVLLNEDEENTGSISLTVNTTEVVKPDAEWVLVSWRGVHEPRGTDVVALYAVEEPSWQSKFPIKSIEATVDPMYLRDGAGSLNVKLLNHRQNVQFLFIRVIGLQRRIVAMSPIITFRYKDAPTGVHLALTDTPNQMSVQWVSRSNARSWVQWGARSGRLRRWTRAKATTYNASDLCGPPATTEGYIFPGYMFNGVIKRLTPGKTYYYRVGNKRGGFSEEYSFKAPPTLGNERMVKIIGLADMGQYNEDLMENTEGLPESLNTSKNINTELDVDLITHIGDISYAEGFVAGWDVFFDQWLPITAQVPYMTILGNHERLYPGSGDRFGNQTGRDSGGECGVVYERRLQMPIQGPDQPWYSFKFASIHFIMFSSEHPFNKGDVQYKYLVRELSSVNRTLTPWLVVGFHRPMYPGITEDSRARGYWFVGQQLQQQLAELFTSYGVDMLWSGHHHSYQRTCPVSKEQCVPFDEETGEARAPVQLIFGNAGARLYTNFVKRPFIEYQGDFHGYVRIFVNSTQLRVEAVRNNDTKVMDSTTLYKAKHHEGGVPSEVFNRGTFFATAFT